MSLFRGQFGANEAPLCAPLSCFLYKYYKGLSRQGDALRVSPFFSFRLRLC